MILSYEPQNKHYQQLIFKNNNKNKLHNIINNEKQKKINNEIVIFNNYKYQISNSKNDNIYYNLFKIIQKMKKILIIKLKKVITIHFILIIKKENICFYIFEIIY